MGFIRTQKLWLKRSIISHIRTLEHLLKGNWLLKMLREKREHLETSDLKFSDLLPKKRAREQYSEINLDSKNKVKIEIILEKMLRFLGEFPVDNYHDYREFRHKGLRSYLINQFMKKASD
jgi:hypothetical protein